MFSRVATWHFQYMETLMLRYEQQTFTTLFCTLKSDFMDVNRFSKFIWAVVHYYIVHIFPRRSIIVWTKRRPGSRTRASCSCHRKISVSLYCIELKENSLKTKEMFKFIGSLQSMRFFNRGSHLEKPRKRLREEGRGEERRLGLRLLFETHQPLLLNQFLTRSNSLVVLTSKMAG